jgi:hypothetical protein
VERLDKLIARTEQQLGEFRKVMAGPHYDRALPQYQFLAPNVVSHEAALVRYRQERAGHIGADTHDLTKLGGKDLEKLRSIGMDDKDLTKVFKHMLKHGETPEGSRLVALNLDKWKPEVRARFINSMLRWTDRIIHENDAATLHRWMSHPIAQMMTQFRTFMMGSWAKSTLYNLHHFDARTFATMMAEIVAGAGTWALTQAGANAFTPDSLKDKLTIEKMAMAGFARAGWTSILPAVADSALMWTPAGPQFSYRSSGTPMDGFLGISAADLEESLRTFARGAQDAAINGHPMSQKDITAGARALPFANFLPFSAALNWMIKDQPKLAPGDTFIGTVKQRSNN